MCLGLKRQITVADVFSLSTWDRTTTTEVAGPPSVRELVVRPPSVVRFHAVTDESRLEFLRDRTFLREFDELYQYYREARLIQLRVVDNKLLAVFQTGATARDVKVLRWAVDPGGRVTYLDNRGERDHTFPPTHDFEWTKTTRADHVEGRHPHVNILDTVFVETVGGDLRRQPVARRRRHPVQSPRLAHPAEDQAVPRDQDLVPGVRQHEPDGGAGQIWASPFSSAEHHQPRPTDGSQLGRIGNQDLVRGISDLFTLVRLIRSQQPTRAGYEALVAACVRYTDAYYWAGEGEVGDLRALVEEVRRTSELVIDEFVKVQVLEQRAVDTLAAARVAHDKVLADVRPEYFTRVDAFLEAMTRLRAAGA